MTKLLKKSLIVGAVAGAISVSSLGMGAANAAPIGVPVAHFSDYEECVVFSDQLATEGIYGECGWDSVMEQYAFYVSLRLPL